MPRQSPAPGVAEGFAPLAARDAQLLILGTLPGRASLAAGQYYAQPQNAFWKIMRELCAAGPELPYELRLGRLVEARIAVWDVCHRAARRGSLDAAIERETILVNDFDGFLRSHRSITAVCFNGATAEELYRRRVLPTLAPRAAALPRLRLPSTSPAHAGMCFARKLEAWVAGFDAARPGRR